MGAYSILVLTLNEERNLLRCLNSAAHCDDIVVLDSGSTDRTVEIARQAGARVFVRAFDTFARQRNHAHRTISFRNPWVFHLDADEQFTPALETECRRAAIDNELDGYFVAPKMLWRGRWIPHCTDYPAWQARFVRARRFEFIDVGHGQRETPHMRMGYLRENYFHDLSSGGEAEWLEKHRRYARAEVQRFLSAGEMAPWRDLIASNRLVRRRALKRLSFSLPFRPMLRFAYQYVFRGGFLDGRAGLDYCKLLSRYEGFIAKELRRHTGSDSCG